MMVKRTSAATDSDPIRIVRVLCIVLMMFVHVPLVEMARDQNVLSETSRYVVHVLDLLGRASVPTLSALSGFLLALTAARLGTVSLAGQRARTLLVPMLFWNFAFGLMGVVNYLLRAREERPVLLDFDPIGWLNTLTGIFDAPALVPLAFLRDLFVVLIIVHLLLPLIRRMPLTFLGAAAAIAVLDASAPLIMRPTILFMVVAGAVLALRGGTLSGLARHPATLPLALTMFLLPQFLPWSAGGVDLSQVANLVLRVGMALIFISASVWLAAAWAGRQAMRLEPQIFLTFLMHVPVMIVWSILWEVGLGDPVTAGYLPFYLSSVLVALVVCQIAGFMLDAMPRPLQLVVRGKAREPRGQRRLPTAFFGTPSGRRGGS